MSKVNPRTLRESTNITRRSFWTGIAGVAAATTFGSTYGNVALARKWATRKQVASSCLASLSIPIDVHQSLKSLNLNRWECSVSEAIANEIGQGAQIRVRRNADQFAAYTIAEVRQGDSDDVVRLNKSGRERLGTSDTFSGTLLPMTATTEMSDSEADEAGECLEWLHESNDEALVILAPHGGGIEINTDHQAWRVRELLPQVTTWGCSGWGMGDSGSYDRWHITTTATSPLGLPRLAKIADRNFAYCVAFHGMSASGIRVGGAAPNELKELVRDAIDSALDGEGVDVDVVGEGDALSGTSSENIVNWLTAGGEGGVQIEQSKDVRLDHWEKVAEAVASVYADLI